MKSGYIYPSSYELNAYNVDYSIPSGGPVGPFFTPSYFDVHSGGGHPTQHTFQLPSGAFQGGPAGQKWSAAGKSNLGTFQSCIPFKVTVSSGGAGNGSFWQLHNQTGLSVNAYQPVAPFGAAQTGLTWASGVNWGYVTYNEFGDDKVRCYSTGRVAGGTPYTLAGWEPFANGLWVQVAGNIGQLLVVGLWLDYILTAEDVALLEGGWTP